MTLRHSPLFSPAVWEGSSFKILDETLLPWRLEYIPASEVAQALQAVREMKTRAFGQVLTFIYAAALVAQRTPMQKPEQFRERLNHLAEEFEQARPTFDFRGVARLFDDWLDDAPAQGDIRVWAQDKIHGLVAKIAAAREQRARRAAELLPNPCRLLTHCNVSGELVVVARWCETMGKQLQFIATETRPYLQGSRLTAWEIAQAGLEVTVIPDCAVAQVMAKGQVDAVLVGADRSAQNGDIINKVGTYPIALIAKEHGIPFCALVQPPGSLARGDDVLIEERPVDELFTLQGRSYLPEGAKEIKGRYPAFDLTPASLISSLVGFDGVFTPESFRARFPQETPAKYEKKPPKQKYLLVYGVPQQSHYSYLSHALAAEKIGGILVPEMRPGLAGVHRVASQLLQRTIPTTLISDNMMGTIFASGQIQKLCLFYTELSQKGPVGICGSLLAALLARSHGVSVELFPCEPEPSDPLDRDISTFMGQRIIPEGVAVYPIESEIISWSLFKEPKAGAS